MLKIVDLEVGNIGSVIKVVKHLGVDFELITQPEQLIGASKIILPGVGSFTAAAKKLHQSGFAQALNEHVIIKKVPVLGICVGMQLLASIGEEGGQSKGLGFINATVKRINSFDGSLIIPHMGWNDIDTNELPIFNNIDNHSCFYFVHSYAMEISDNQDIKVAYTNYGENIVAYVNKGHIHGAQFHPEKSQHVGIQFLRNFIK
ncbi:MAG: glutamine amidotransferase [Cognaticolwellia sp.]|jgi:glutamine amidotransferase